MVNVAMSLELTEESSFKLLGQGLQSRLYLYFSPLMIFEDRG